MAEELKIEKEEIRLGFYKVIKDKYEFFA